MDTLNTARPAGRGGRRVVELLIAIVFLTVIGAAAGYVVGHRVRESRTGGTGGPATGDTPTGTQPTTGAASATKLCLDVTERDAKSRFRSPGGLVQVLYIRTDRSEVWICEDKIHNLFYQGHVLSPGERPPDNRAAFTDDNSIILQSVTRTSPGYVAVNSDGNGTTRYRVSKDQLVIEYSDGRVERQDVVVHDP